MVEKFFKKLRGDNKVENALQRLDRLVQEESRTSGAQALAVIHSVDRKIDVLIDGAQTSTRLAIHRAEPSRLPLDGKRAAGSAQEAPGTSHWCR
jgi:hypothetical protein